MFSSQLTLQIVLVGINWTTRLPSKSQKQLSLLIYLLEEFAFLQEKKKQSRPADADTALIVNTEENVYKQFSFKAKTDLQSIYLSVCICIYHIFL